ncbi:transposase [Alteromonas sp. 1_MG-2023]|uniref:transposase n=1 Tax=Alteromonas sp. 1_MG-2023 TaxID=3062669 RepID=UPI0026E418AA|nr:transposase [Alteromonas sp. 1_MG-2023]MDO6567538.1 transposase [Alteromonas sp. 1_MG-2023]
MPQSRSSQISLADTPYYHCISRCVRQCYLCGVDQHSGKSYEHRRGWVERRLLNLAKVFSIDICAYAVMSNHVHVVLHVDKKKANAWNVKKVLTQWHQIHKGTLLTQKYLKGEQLSESEAQAVNDTATIYRRRLFDISWFMRSLNEYIARAANKEDECTGRFWEGRFKSQALLNENALISCMAYVDLNPIRAKIANTPEHSKHTSIYCRLSSLKLNQQPAALLHFAHNSKTIDKKGLPFDLIDYLELVDTTGRSIRDDKPGYIETACAPILSRIGMNNAAWHQLTTKFEELFTSAAGCEATMNSFKHNTNHKRARGIKNAKLLG